METGFRCGFRAPPAVPRRHRRVRPRRRGAIELTDVIFAVDSIPAIFAVTRDPFIVFTSNIFAILGLRSMYFLLAGVVPKFRYLKIGLSLVLVFVGAKMLLADLIEIPIVCSLAAIAILLGGAGVASAWRPLRAAGSRH